MDSQAMRTLLLALPLVLAGPAFAEEDWTGKTVITKRNGTKIGHTNEAGQMVYVAELKGVNYIVRKDKSGYLLIAEKDQDDWALKSDFVLIEDAVTYFTDRIRENPGDPNNWSKRAFAWQHRGELDIAIRDHDEALRLSPEAAGFNNRGICLRRKKDYDRAIRDFDEAIRLDPKYVNAFANRGTAWAGKKDFDRAIRDYDEAIRLDPKLGLAYYNKACALALQEKSGPALDQLERALELNYRKFDHMEKDSDLDSIRDDPRYKELIQRYKK